MAADPDLPILVVDDYRTMLRIIRDLLRQAGFNRIDEATSAAEALEKLEERPFGLVISDWNMQPMTGLDLLDRVRANPHLAKLPFIMITAESKAENVVAAKRAGVDGYIVKPFNAETLKARIAAVVPET